MSICPPQIAPLFLGISRVLDMWEKINGLTRNLNSSHVPLLNGRFYAKFAVVLQLS